MGKLCSNNNLSCSRKGSVRNLTLTKMIITHRIGAVGKPESKKKK